MTHSVDTRSTPHSPKPRHRLWQKLLLTLAGLYAGYVVISWLAVPGLVESQAQAFAEKKLGSRFSAGSISFNPFRVAISIDKPQLADKQDGTVWWQANQLQANVNLITTLLKRMPVLDELQLHQPVFRAERDESGQWRYPRISRKPGSQETRPLALRIDHLGISGGSLRWQDNASQPVALELKKLDYQHDNFNTGDQPSHFTVQTETTDGAWLQISGDYVHSRQQLNADWQLKNLSLPHWLKKTGTALPGLSLEKGNASGTGTVAWDGQREALKLDARQIQLADLTIRDSSPEAGSASPPLAFIPALEIHGASLDSQRHAITLEQVTLDNSHLNARLPAETAQNKSPPSQQGTTPSPQPAASTRSPPWQVLIKSVAMKKGQLNLVATSNTTPVTLGIEELHLENIGNGSQTASGEVHLRLPATGTMTSGQATLKAKYQPETKIASVSHQLRQAALGPWLGLLQPYLNISQISGQVDSRGQWTVTPSGLKGQVSAQVNNLSLHDNNQRPVIGWQTLDVGESDIDSTEKRIRLGPVKVSGLNSHIELDKTGLSLKKLLRTAPAKAAGKNTSATGDNHPSPKPDTDKHWRIELNNTAVTAAKVQFVDKRVQPAVALQAQNLSALVTKADNKAQQPLATVKLTAVLDKFTHARANAALSPGGNPVSPKGEGGLRNLDLATLSPYARQYLGYAIKSGKADVDIDYAIRGQKLKGELNLTMVKLKLEKAAGTPVLNLPLKTALALLTDGKGITHLRIPFEGDVSDPDFSVGHLVVKAFVNAITGIATSPFKILAKLTGLKKEDLQKIRFEPGEYALRATETAKLQKLAQALQKRPAVGLRITGKANSKTDAAALRFKSLLDDLGLPTTTRPQDLPKVFLKDTVQDRLRRLFTARLGFARWATLQEQYGANPVKLAQHAWQQLLQSVSIDRQALLQLASQRAKTVRDYLIESEGMAASRVSHAPPVVANDVPPVAQLAVQPLS